REGADSVLVSASSGPHSAYIAGRSDGRLYRRVAGGHWERVRDGWPDPPSTIAPLLDFAKSSRSRAAIMIQNLAAFSPPQDRVNLLRWEIVSQYPDQVRETGEAGRSIGVAPLPRGQFEHMRGTRCRWPFAD